MTGQRLELVLEVVLVAQFQAEGLRGEEQGRIAVGQGIGPRTFRLELPLELVEPQPQFHIGQGNVEPVEETRCCFSQLHTLRLAVELRRQEAILRLGREERCAVLLQLDVGQEPRQQHVVFRPLRLQLVDAVRGLRVDRLQRLGNLGVRALVPSDLHVSELDAPLGPEIVPSRSQERCLDQGVEGLHEGHEVHLADGGDQNAACAVPNIAWRIACGPDEFLDVGDPPEDTAFDGKRDIVDGAHVVLVENSPDPGVDAGDGRPGDHLPLPFERLREHGPLEGQDLLPRLLEESRAPDIEA
mmetsp:Transcript_35249/g.69995  ORF Transcript_35249/g.69995 Transcript_35249/m.69995 type:complete len:299 (+) Transcript_35249:148-1044(+)